jgi:uncharacterized delta-60 repeat protein
MVTSIGGVPFGSILYIDGVSINDIVSYMGTIITPPTSIFYYVAGNFGGFKEPTFSRIVATNLSGSIDTTFNPGQTGFNGTVRCMVTQSDGKLIIGGDFTTYSGSANNFLVRINPNGTKDTTFTATLNSSVYTAAVQSDGKIVIGGSFSIVNAVSVPRLARLNSNGTRDTTWNPGTAGAGNIVRDVKMQSDGKILAVGDFVAYSGSTRNRIVRTETSGTIDNTFNVGAGLGNSAYNVHIQSDGKIITAGAFTTYSGSSNNYIVRINSNGTKDNTFTIGTGFNQTVYISSLQPDGKIIAAGIFGSYSGSTNNYIARVNSDGTKDNTFNVGTGLNAPGWSAGITNTISYDTENNIYLASDNVTYSGSAVPRIFKLKPNGTLDTTYDAGVGLNRFGLANVVSGNRLYTAGTFTNYKAAGATGIAMVSDSATLSSSFNPGIGFNNDVWAMTKQSTGRIIVGGAFTNYSGSSRTRIVGLNSNGTIDPGFNVGTAGASSIVYALATQTDDKIIVGGMFTAYSGSSTSTTRLMRLNSNGTQDLTYNTGAGTGLNAQPTCILILSSGKAVVGGSFTTYSGSTVNYIVQINSNGTKDTTFNTGTGFNSTISSAVTQSDGKIIVVGNFSTYSGSAVGNRIIRLNTDGTRDTTFNVGTGLFSNAATAIALQSDGKAVVGGAFTTYSGSANNYLVRINTNGTKDTSFVIGTGLDGAVSTNGITIGSDGTIYCLGSFTTYSGSNSRGIVAINPNGTINQTFTSGLGTASFNNTAQGFTYLQPPNQMIPV